MGGGVTAGRCLLLGKSGGFRLSATCCLALSRAVNITFGIGSSQETAIRYNAWRIDGSVRFTVAPLIQRVVDCHSSRLASNKPKRDAVAAVAQAGRWRPVLKDVAVMSAAASAVILGPRYDQLEIRLEFDVPGKRIVKTWPAGPAIELELRWEQFKATSSADEHTLAFLVVEGAGKGGLSPVLAQNLVLIRGQELAPLGIGPGDSFDGLARQRRPRHTR